MVKGTTVQVYNADAVTSTEFGLVRTPDVFVDALAHAPANGMVWCVIHAISDTVITAISYSGTAVAGYAGLTLVAGDRLYGRWTSIQAASGAYECIYLHPNLT